MVGERRIAIASMNTRYEAAKMTSADEKYIDRSRFPLTCELSSFSGSPASASEDSPPMSRWMEAIIGAARRKMMIDVDAMNASSEIAADFLLAQAITAIAEAIDRMAGMKNDSCSNI